MLIGMMLLMLLLNLRREQEICLRLLILSQNSTLMQNGKSSASGLGAVY